MVRFGSMALAALCGLMLFAGMTALGTPAVVVNEIAWGGTAAGSQDEWVELRNCTASSIDLTGWVLVLGGARVPLSVVAESTLEVRASTIEPNGFLLLERTDDTTVSTVAGDILYKGSLSNAGVAIQLQDAAGNVIDEVAVGEAGWPAGCVGDGAVPFATMERVDPAEMGDAWRTNDGLVVCGLDAAGGAIAGTPRAANSATINYAKAPRVELQSPEGGDWTCPVAIEWRAVDPDGPTAGLAIAVYVRDASAEEWTLVVENLANQGTCPWDCSALARGVAYQVKVTAVDRDGRVGTAVSDPFTLR
jgi:hypothetical protein